MEIGSHNDRSQEVLPSVICKLESRKAAVYNSVQLWRLEDEVGTGVTPSLSSKTWEQEFPCQAYEKRDIPA
jgi:hypothetical protein